MSLPGTAVLTNLGRQVDYWLIGYLRTWKGSIVSGFLLPVLYLASLGVGVGRYVDKGQHRADLGGLTYLQFLAPALLAATAMQIAFGETTFPVMSKLTWNRVFEAMVSTPLRAVDVVAGVVASTSFRVLSTCSVFLLVITLFGAVSSPLALLCLPAVVLMALAFAGPTLAYSAFVRTDSALSVVYRVGMIPAFLFSGAFFPVRNLPDAIEWLAYVVPLWHGVVLCREFAAGDVYWLGVLGHCAYLLLWFAVGAVAASRVMARRLES